MTILYKGNLNNDYDYLFTDNDLIELFDFLNQYYNITSVDIKKVNDFEQVLYDFNDIRRIDNYKKDKILSISTSAYLRDKDMTYRGSPILYLKIQNINSTFGMTLNISYNWYDEADGLKITDYLTRFLNKRKRSLKYSLLNIFTKFVYLFLPFISTAFVIISLINIESIKESKNLIYFLIFSIIIFFLGIISLLRGYIVSFLTPKIVFMFGDEISEENNREKLRSHIFWGILIGGIVFPLFWLIIQKLAV